MASLRPKLNLEARRNELDRTEDQKIKHTFINGRVQVPGLGQSFVEVDFPVVFAEKPYITYGLDVEQGGEPITVAMWHAQVVGYEKRKKSPRQTYYTGATIAVAIQWGALGRSDGMKFTLVWIATGDAFVGVASGSDTVDGEV